MTPEHDLLYEKLKRRYERERAARREAEAIAERVTGELFAATEELQAANQAIRDFVAVASHDLKSPLTSIIGSASLLQQRWSSLTDEQRDELLGAASRQGMHMSRMIDDLLTVSRIEAGVIEPHVATIELRHAIDSAVSALGDGADEVIVSGVEEPVVRCDPDHLERILNNYIGNAIKYGEPPIDIGAGPSGDDAVEVRVSDHGNGVPEELVPRLFGRFARGDDDRTRSKPGSGLGLSIVRGLARANGGDAWYEPVVPHGSCFGVRLPSARA